ncbi:MAG: hypothetical protein EBS37_07265 [Betaproteobacteria bacterium]|nr:hypothetical protein [Betaproteobacteria bacterium]
MAPAGMSVASKAPLEASFGHASTDTKPDAGKTLEERDNGLETEELSEAALRKLGVPSDDIVDAFKVCSDSAQNDEWWQQRMSNAKRNKKLLPARIRAGKSSKGVQRIQSWWSPLLIASFLIQGKHMPPTKAVRILNESFPDFSVDSHLLMP